MTTQTTPADASASAELLATVSTRAPLITSRYALAAQPAHRPRDVPRHIALGSEQTIHLSPALRQTSEFPIASGMAKLQG